jgi:transposase
VRTHRASFVGNGNATWLTQTNPARSVLDAGWSSYRTMLKYQCDDAGAWFQEIDESFTTQACHMCGARLGPKGRAELDVREWTCAVCGTLHDRDANAARNIKARGLAWLAEQFAMADSAHTTSAAAVNKASGDALAAALGHGRLAVGIP